MTINKVVEDSTEYRIPEYKEFKILSWILYRVQLFLLSLGRESKTNDMEEKIYVLDWGNGMVGIFRGSDLSQIDNGTKEGFFSSLKHIFNVKEYERVVVEFLRDREQLQQLRESRGLERKPTLDEYLNQLKNENKYE